MGVGAHHGRQGGVDEEAKIVPQGPEAEHVTDFVNDNVQEYAVGRESREIVNIESHDPYDG